MRLLLCEWSLVCGWSHNVPLTLCMVRGLWLITQCASYSVSGPWSVVDHIMCLLLCVWSLVCGSTHIEDTLGNMSSPALSISGCLLTSSQQMSSVLRSWTGSVRTDYTGGWFMASVWCMLQLTERSLVVTYSLSVGRSVGSVCIVDNFCNDQKHFHLLLFLNWPITLFLLLLQLHPSGTLYLLTFNCAFSLSNATWKSICSNSLSPPVLHQAPLYLQT